MSLRYVLAIVVTGGIAIVVAPFSRQVIRGDGPATPAPAASVQVGRFQLEGIPNYIYVLDTATGQVWERFPGTQRDEFLQPKIKVGMQSRGAGVQEETAASRRELTRMRAHIRVLERKVARRTKPQALAEHEPTFQGKPLSDWVRMLQDGDPAFRARAAEAVAAIGPPACSAMPALITVAAQEALQEIVSRSLEPRPAQAALRIIDPDCKIIHKQLHHAEFGSRRDAAFALLAARATDSARENVGKWPYPGDRDVIPVLIEIMRDRGHMPPRTAFAHQVLSLEFLAAFGPEAAPAMPVVCELVQDGDPSVRENAARLLGMIGAEAQAAVPLLLNAFKEGTPELRVAAAEGLCGFGSKARPALPLLLAGLKDPDAHIRAVSAAALGGIGASETLPALLEALNDQADEVRQRTIDGLAGMQASADAIVPVLLRALNDASHGVQLSAFTTLGEFGPKAAAAVPELVRRAKNPDDPCAAEAIKALRKIAPGEAAKIPGQADQERAPQVDFRAMPAATTIRVVPDGESLPVPRP